MGAPVPQTVLLAIGGPIARTDFPDLCREVCDLLERTGAEIAICDVSAVEADAASVDVLARLQLAARRRGCESRLQGVSAELRELLTFMGLHDVLQD
jgi:ABC-type transporter Mla MlaB component